MLQELIIKNFAIIDDLHIRFSDGLTILSGETGAGKSIIIQTINLILGHRVTTRHIRSGSESAQIEALFHITTGSKVARIMEQNGYDPKEGLLIRRIISRNDKHRIYINGHLSTVQVLSAITENLASISGQHAHQGLLQEEQHLLILDQFGELIPLQTRVYEAFHTLVPLIKKHENLKALQDRQAEHIQLLMFQKNEIINAAITPGEDTALEQEQKKLKHADALCRTLQDILGVLYHHPGAVIESLGEVKKSLDRASLIDTGLSSKTEAVAQAMIHLEDITEELRHYLETIDVDGDRLEVVESRIFALQKLKRKYGKTLEEVLSYLDNINRSLGEVENISESISKTESELLTQQDRLAKSAITLSQKRHIAANILAKKVEEELATLGMDRTQFQVYLQKNPASTATPSYMNINGHGVSEYGIDRVTFMIAPNVGEDLKPLASIVSGGELSRVVLALKAILAQTESVETVVFDEVDAGIGGKVAEVVGKKLLSLSRYYQTICITHLPQIAKFGNHHIKIFKEVSHGRTVTLMEPLSNQERIKEIARMLGGVTITPTTLEHAREMLEDAKVKGTGKVKREKRKEKLGTVT